jgi:class 3 adenylate cyclase/predicted ATPase
LFCDLVGSTAISAQLDAEEWRDLVGAYLDAASAAIAEMGGHVAKKLGDGLMCLFGYPLAHENDAERAVRAALSIQRALAELNRKHAGTASPELAARIGLESGHAVLDASGEIYGDVANIAARVQALAEPGEVLVTARVQRQVAGLFVAEERGTYTLKGVPEPTALFRLVRASGGGRRSGQRNLTPLVGRDEEIAVLMRRWERARQGEGQLVLIVGEPGLGKSRLIEEFHLRLKETPHTWSEWTCSQLLQNTPLHPIAEFGRQRFGGADTPAERRLADLENTLALVKLDPAENASLLAPLLDIPLPKERVSALAPEELRRRQLAAVTNWVMAGAKAQPLVLAFEDLHWADPTTLDVLRGIAERGALVPLYIVATARPEFRPPWGMRSHHSTISLAPLDRGQVRDMVAELSVRHALSRDVVDDVAARTGGVPLFVEEVTRLLLERGEQGGAQAIPPTLQQSLMARLDRLGPAREVAQIGSVIGRGFSYKLLKAVAGVDDAPLETALEKLSDADIVLVEGVLPESEYRFKHALIQDAAYENLLKRRRQALHRRIAETLRDRFPDSASAEPEILAHHFTQAGLTDAAIEWWGKAGDQALRRSAFQEAIAHLGKAIEMADSTSEGPTPGVTAPSGRLKLQTNYGQALILGKGYTAPETLAAFARARELLVAKSDSSDPFETYYGQWAAGAMRGEYALAQEIATAFLREAESASRTLETATAHRMLGLTHLWRGHFTEAQSHLTAALQICDQQTEPGRTLLIGLDTRALAAVYLAQTDWILGEFGRIRELLEGAVARATQLGHVPTLATTYMFRAMFEAFRGDAEAVRRESERVTHLSEQHEIPTYLALGSMARGWSRAQLGDIEGGKAELRDGITGSVSQGTKAYVPFFQGLLAEVEAGCPNDEAVRWLDEALALAQDTGAHGTDAFLHRIRGEILLRRDPANTALAEEAFLTAIAIAQQQKAKSFELRAALSLAKLYQSTGRALEAHDILSSALEGFSPTPEFPEIAESQVLLAAVAKTDEVKNAATSRQRRLKLQTNYGRAMMWSKGYAAQETKLAFARARDLCADITDPAERFPTYYGLWVGSLMRGELASARETAKIFLGDAESGAWPTEAAAARRVLGQTCLWQGDFKEAQTHFEEALKIYDPERDRDVKFRFGMDTGAGSRALLAVVKWLFGDTVRARELIESALAIAAEFDHVGTLAPICYHRAELEILRGDADLALRFANTLLELSRERGMPLFLALGAACRGWANAKLGRAEEGIAELRDGLTSFTEQGNRTYVPFLKVLLAEIEAEGQDSEGALVRIDEALTLVGETGEHWTDALLHRIRGEILVKRDPANTAPAEEALLTAIAIAQQQKAKSFELRAALSLAKLYQSTSRAANGHAILAPVLEGFSPTPEFPEVAVAHALLASLADTDEVKSAIASRQRRLKLQNSYGQALLWSKGYGAEGAKEAFKSAREIAAHVDNNAEGLPSYYGLWVGCLFRGELGSARALAEDFLCEAKSAGRMTEAAVASRNLGLTCLVQGDVTGARTHLEEALKLHDPAKDREAKFRFGQDPCAAAKAFLAQAYWVLGEVKRARLLIDEAVARAIEVDHIPSLANAYVIAANVEMFRGEAAAARRVAEALVELSREHPMALYAAFASIFSGWARARLGDRETGTTELRQALTSYTDQGNKLFVPFYQARLAEIEAEDKARKER